ncbi:MAG: hypothetical protein QM724_03765 [Flavobacteriales bacterium]
MIREGQEQRPEQPDLHVQRQVQAGQRAEVRVVRLGLHHAVGDAEEQRQAAQQCVDEEAHGDGPAPLAAPVEQQEEHRQQRQFVEDVEEEGVLRHEHRQQEALCVQQQRVHHGRVGELLLEARADDEGEGHRRQQQHQQAHAVVPEGEPEPPGRHPVAGDGQHGSAGVAVPQPQHHAQGHQGGGEGDAPRGRGGPGQHQERGGQERNEQEDQQHHLMHRIGSTAGTR